MFFLGAVSRYHSNLFVFGSKNKKDFPFYRGYENPYFQHLSFSFHKINACEKKYLKNNTFYSYFGF